MNKTILIIIALPLVIIIALFMLNKFEPSLIVQLLFGFIFFCSVFFSRGILIVLTVLCLAFTQSYFPTIATAALSLRWVFFSLFSLHVFGDIFLGRTVRRIKSFDVLAIVFLIYAFLSRYYSPFPSLTSERAMTVSALYIAVFWIIWKYAYDQGLEKVVSLLLNVAMLVFIMGYLMIFIGPYRPFMAGRFTGIFSNPNGLGVICAILLPVSLWQFLETRKRTSLLLFFLILLALLLSGARGSINATVMALGYFIYIRSKKYRPLLFFALMSFALVMLWVIEILIKEFFKAYIRVETIPILGGRLEIWPVALTLIMNKPIFGYGFGTEDKLIELKKIILRQHVGAYVHNSYLGMLLQLGIIGFIIFYIPLFILLFKELFLTRDTPVSLLRYALRASLIAGLICCIYESWIYSVGNAVAFPFWILVMLLTFCRYRDKEKGIVEVSGT